jgi:hypothetical protein
VGCSGDAATPGNGVRLGEVGCAASSIAGDLIEAYLGTTYQLGMGGAGPSLRIGEPVGSGPGTVGGLLADAGATCRSRSVASHVACAFFGDLLTTSNF